MFYFKYNRPLTRAFSGARSLQSSLRVSSFSWSNSEP